MLKTIHQKNRKIYALKGWIHSENTGKQYSGVQEGVL